MKTITSNNEKDTVNLGVLLGANCQGGEVFALSGDLGAGKTKLANGVARGLGIRTPITSPTFNIFRVYKVSKNKKIKNFYHIDAYRLKSEKDLVNLGVEEFLGRPDTVVLIEWAEKVEKVFGKIKKIKIILESVNEKERLIKIYGIKNF